MQAASSLAQRRQAIQAQIQQHASKGRTPELLAVTKGQPAEKVRALFELGQRRFGENYSQELLEKAQILHELPLEWVYIGHLQSNKIRRLVEVTSEIQTVDNLRHAQKIATAAREYGKTPFPIMLEVNAGMEEGKSGLPMMDVPALAATIARDLPELKVRGIMAIPPSCYQDSECEGVPELYRELRALADSVGDGILSLGMSGDLRLAIQAGTDIVRIGTALLGART